MSTRVCVSMCMYLSLCAHTCVCAYLNVCALFLLFTCVSAHVYICVQTYVHSCLRTCVPVCTWVHVRVLSPSSFFSSTFPPVSTDLSHSFSQSSYQTRTEKSSIFGSVVNGYYSDIYGESTMFHVLKIRQRRKRKKERCWNTLDMHIVLEPLLCHLCGLH